VTLVRLVEDVELLVERMCNKPTLKEFVPTCHCNLQTKTKTNTKTQVERARVVDSLARTW
jgi:hypothetical protein